MSSIRHPGYIDHYTDMHTEFLRTMPNGTYAIYSTSKKQPEIYFQLVISYNGKIIGWNYSESTPGELSWCWGDSLTLHFGTHKYSIFDLIGDGITTHKNVNLSTPIQLTNTLNMRLAEDPDLIKAFEQKREEMVYAELDTQRKIYELQTTTRSIIYALTRDIDSGRYRYETNVKIGKAIHEMESMGGSVDNCLNILTALVAKLTRIRSYDTQILAKIPLEHTKKMLEILGLPEKQPKKSMIPDPDVEKVIARKREQIAFDKLAQNWSSYFHHEQATKDLHAAPESALYEASKPKIGT